MSKKKYIIGIALMVFVITFVAFWSPITHTLALGPFFSGEPDLPSFLTEENSDVDEGELIMRREEAIAMRRGIYKDVPFDPSLRPKAIEKMEAQEARVADLAAKSNSPEAVQAAWTPIGPAPIPNGQTAPEAPVSGRTIAIAIHPTNPNIVYVGTAQGGVYRSTDGGANWTPIFDSAQSLVIGAIAFAPSDPTILYVGTGEANFGGNNYFGVGVYRINTDAAHTTATLTGPLNKNAAGSDVFTGVGIGKILVHPTNPDIIFVAAANADNGLRPAANPPRPTRGLYRSNNASTAAPTFSYLSVVPNFGVNVRDIAFDVQNPNDLVANVVAGLAGNPAVPLGGLYTSRNALNADPTTVTFVQTRVFNSNDTSQLVAELTAQKSGGINGSRIFYAAAGEGGGKILRSLNSGATWTTRITNQFCNPQCFYDVAIDVDPQNFNILHYGGSPNLIIGRSDNAGVSLAVQPTAGLHGDTQVVAVAPSDTMTVYLGTDGGIYKSTDMGATYTPLNNSGFSATQFNGLSVHPTDPNFTIGGTQDNGTNFYQPDATWTRVDSGDGGFTVIDQNAVDTVNVRMYHTYFNTAALQGYGTVATTADALSRNWTFRGCQAAGATGNGITCEGTVNFYAPLERGPGNPNTIYYGTDRIYRSADNGATNTVVSQNPIVAGVPISSIGISPQNDNVRITGLNNGGLYGTSTGLPVLSNLDPANMVPDVPINRTIIDPNNQATAYVTLSVFGMSNVWKTTNLGDVGTIWTNASGTGANALPQVPVNAIVVDPLSSSTVYVGTDIGVYVSTDGGANWMPFGTGLPRVAVFDMQIVRGASPRLVRIATYGRGMFQTPVFTAPTAAGVSVSGRVLIGKRGLTNATVYLTNQNGEKLTSRTTAFGYYHFDDLAAGQTVVLTVVSKRYQFAPQVVNLTDDLTNFDFNLYQSPTLLQSGLDGTKFQK